MANLNNLSWLNSEKTLPDAIRAYERYWIERALQLYPNITAAARLLGMSHQALTYAIEHRHPDLRPDKRRHSIIKK